MDRSMALPCCEPRIEPRWKDRTKVEGWNLLFKPGKQEFLLTAPAEPGEYEVVCTVICSEDHEGMHMKFTVLP
jgi:hypothetical protein